jgi:hypothetical protein
MLVNAVDSFSGINLVRTSTRDAAKKPLNSKHPASQDSGSSKPTGAKAKLRSPIKFSGADINQGFKLRLYVLLLR